MVINDFKKIRMQEYMLNKKEFAGLLQVSEQQYCRYENMTTQPSLEVALKMSNALDKPVNSIWRIE